MSVNRYEDSEQPEEEDRQPRQPVFKRLAAAGRTGAAAAGSATLAALATSRDGLESFRYGARQYGHKMDKWAAEGVVGRAFRFKERAAKLTTELRAGLITFLMVSYILAVNPSILSTTGGTCNPQDVCTPENYQRFGRQCLANPDDPGAVHCLAELERSLITATAASSLISTFFIGYFGNLPLALAPGIGINAYVAYQVVGQFGEGQLTYQQAMTAIFVEGWFFVVLSVTGVRGGIIKYMPKSIAMASSVGIGMLLAFTGLRNMGVIVFDSATLLTLGGCSEEHRNYLYSFDHRLGLEDLSNMTLSSLPVPATVYGCIGQEMRSPTMWLGIAGGFLMCILLYMGVKGSLILGIAFVTIISWIPGHGATYLGSSSPIPGGEARYNVFKQVVAAPSLSMTGLAWDWSAFRTGKLWLALFTFLYIDLLDCTGTLLSMARLLDFSMPGFLSENMEFQGQMWAFLSDGIGIITGSMMGTTPLTVYIESAAGIEDGGRTGLTAVVVSFFFFVSLFFSPILASIPPYATGPALVLVGTILLGHIAHIEWDDIGVAIPAFLTMVLMPFTYSVAYGVIAGLVSYLAIHLPFWIADFIRKRWWPDAPESPRENRAKRRNKAGYHMRKSFGPHGGDAPSRAESYAGYDDSYHTQDSRRGVLPISMMPPGGGAAAMGNTAAGGSMHGLPLPASIRTSIPPSMVNMYFQDTSLRGGSGFVGRPGSFTSAEEADAPAPAPPNGVLKIFRKSYSMQSPSRTTEVHGPSGGEMGAHPRSLPVMYRNQGRPTDFGGSSYGAAGSYGSHGVLPTGLSPSGRGPGGAPPGYRPGGGGGSLPRQLLPGGAAQHGLHHTAQPPLPPPAPALGLRRSRTFSHGVSELQGSRANLSLQQSSSEHGGNMFKLFSDAPELEAQQSGVSSQGGFKLFGEVGPLPLVHNSDMGCEADGRRTTSDSGLDMAAQQSFRLFGEIEPLPLSMSVNLQGAAAEAVREWQQPQGGEEAEGRQPGSRELAHLPDANHQVGAADPTSASAGAGASSPLECMRHGSTAYSDLLEAQASEESVARTLHGEESVTLDCIAAASSMGPTMAQPAAEGSSDQRSSQLSSRSTGCGYSGAAATATAADVQAAEAEAAGVHEGLLQVLGSGSTSRRNMAAAAAAAAAGRGDGSGDKDEVAGLSSISSSEQQASGTIGSGPLAEAARQMAAIYRRSNQSVLGGGNGSGPDSQTPPSSRLGAGTAAAARLLSSDSPPTVTSGDPQPSSSAGPPGRPVDHTQQQQQQQGGASASLAQTPIAQGSLEQNFQRAPSGFGADGSSNGLREESGQMSGFVDDDEGVAD